MGGKRDLCVGDKRESENVRYGPHVKRKPEAFERRFEEFSAWVEEHRRLPKKHKTDTVEFKAANILGHWQQQSRAGELSSEQLDRLAKIPCMQERIVLWTRPPVPTWAESLGALNDWSSTNGRLPLRREIFRAAETRSQLSAEEAEEGKHAQFLQYLQTQYTGVAKGRKMTDEQLEQVMLLPHIGIRIWKWDCTKVLWCSEFVVDEYDEKDPIIEEDEVFQSEFLASKNRRRVRMLRRGVRTIKDSGNTWSTRDDKGHFKKGEKKKLSFRERKEGVTTGDAPVEDATEVAKRLAAEFMSSQTAEELEDNASRSRSASPSPSSSSAAESLPSKPAGEAGEEPAEPVAEGVSFLVQALCEKCANWASAEQRLNWLWQSGTWQRDEAGCQAVLVSGRQISAEDLRGVERQCRRHFGVACEGVARFPPLASSATPVDIVERVLARCANWAAASRELEQVWTAGDWMPDGRGVFLGDGRPGLEVPAEVWRAGFEISADGLREAEQLCRQRFGVPEDTCPLPVHRRPPPLLLQTALENAAPVSPAFDERGPQHRRRPAKDLKSALNPKRISRRPKGIGTVCTWGEPVVASVAPVASMKGQDLWNTSAYTVQCDWCQSWAPQKTGQIWNRANDQPPLWICIRCVGEKDE